MKNMYNNTIEYLSSEQHKAIIESEELIEKAFKRKIHKIYINNPTKQQTGTIGGVNFEFGEKEK